MSITLPPFAPFFKGARITNKVDKDGDGYARQFDIEFDVDSNVSGQFYVKAYEDDGSTFLDDPLTPTSATYTVNGASVDYHTLTMKCDENPGVDQLGHGTADLRLDLINAATGAVVQTWRRANDANLGDVLVEQSSEDPEPAIARTPTTLSGSITQGATATSQTFEVWNSGGGTLNYTIGDDATWLSVSSASGTSTGAHTTHTVTYATSGLAVGSYSATIATSAAGVSNSPQTIAVALTVTLPPFAPFFKDARITNKVDKDGDGYARQFDIEFDVDSNVSGQFYVKAYEDDGSTFLDDPLTPTSATYTVNGASVDYHTLTMKCDENPGVDQLGHGTADLRLDLINAATGAVVQTWRRANDANLGDVLVEQSSEDPEPAIARTPTTLSGSITQGATATSRTFEVWNSGGGTLSYATSDDVSWLSVSPASGTSTGAHTTHTVTYATSGLAVGNYSATIAISAAGVTNSPQTIAVSLTVSAPVASDPYGIGLLEPTGIGLFATIPVANRNNLLDLAKLKDVGLFIGDRSVNATDRKLIVVIHGWNLAGDPDVRLSTIAEAISSSDGTDRIGRNWRAIAYDWSSDASTGSTYGIPPAPAETKARIPAATPQEIVLEGGATEAAERAYQHGLLIGAKILQQVGHSNLEAVHLVGHSAGSWAAYAALRYLNANAPVKVSLQVTYLDPFVPAEVDFNNNQNFSVAQLASAPSFCRVVGSLAVKAEQDWAEDWWTATGSDTWPTAGTNTPFSWSLPDAVVFRTDGFTYGDANWDGHSGPTRFYAATVTSPDLAAASGNGWKHSLAYNDYRVMDVPTSAVSLGSATVGQSGITETVRVRNTGRSPLPTLSAATDKAWFTVNATVASNLQPNTYLDIPVTYTPTQGGTQTGSLTLSGDFAGSPVSIPLTALGLERVQTLQVGQAGDFGAAEIGGGFTVRTLTIGNSGNAALRVTAMQLPVGFQGNPLPSFPADIAAGGALNVSVAFRPLGLGLIAGDIVVTSNRTSGEQRIAVSGTGLPIPPTVVTQPGNRAVIAPQPASFAISATGTAPLAYEWQRQPAGQTGFTSLLGDPNYSGASSATLMIAATTLAMHGDQFRCLVTNASTTGAVSNVGVLSVGTDVVTPTIPGSIQINPNPPIAGQLLTFSVSVVGTEPLSYQWRKEGSPIVGAVNATYVIDHVSTTDAGRYSVVVTNSAGSATSGELELPAPVIPPSITTQPQTQTVTAGTSATFTVIASGTAPLSYQWRKGGNPISGATEANLVVPDVSESAAGTYDVLVSNTGGSATSDPAVLTVDAAPVSPSITTQPVDQTVSAGQTATLAVVATGTAPLSYQWYEGASPSTATPISGATAASYTTPALITTTSYWVRVSNSAGSADSATGIVTVSSFAPTVALTSESGSSYSTTGGSATLRVRVTYTGHTPTALGATISLPAGWTFASYSGPSAAASPAVGDTALEWAFSAIPANELNFTFTVNYASGLTGNKPVSGSVDYRQPIVNVPFSSLAFTPIVLPAITTQPVNQAVGVGTGVTFTVVATGTGPLTYQWKKSGSNLVDDSRITGATTATLSIASINTVDAGIYSVVVSNSGGGVTSTGATLAVVDARASHSVLGGGYVAGRTVTITNTITYTGALSGLGWSVLPPSGWNYVSGGGSEGDVRPLAGDTGLFEWAWTSIPASPVTFSYTMNVPAGSTGTQTFAAQILPRQAASQFRVPVLPDPLSIEQVTYHSADTNHDFKFGLTELLRVIELYNTRNGTSRTGCYAVDGANTEDGFATDSLRGGSTVVSLAKYHSADVNHDGKLSLTELLRLIELYNYRSGTSRTGQYRAVQAGEASTEDGFTPGT